MIYLSKGDYKFSMHSNVFTQQTDKIYVFIYREVSIWEFNVLMLAIF